MKTLRQSYQDHLDSGETKIVHCLRIVRQDGETFRFTEFNRDLEMSNGAVYNPDQSSASVSAVSAGSDFDATKFDIEGALTQNGINRDDVAAGLFDFATIYLFRTRWDDPVEDDERIAKGHWGKSEIKDYRFVNEFRGIGIALEQKIGRVHQVTCDADLGDSRCKVRLDPPEWSADTNYEVREDGDAGSGNVVRPSTENGRHFKCVTAGTSGSSEPSWNTSIGATTTDGGVEWEAIRALSQTDTVASVTDGTTFRGGLSFPSDWFGGGTVRFTGGDNDGIEMEVKSYDQNEYVLWQPMPFEMKAGDTFVAKAGCRKRDDEDCISKFNNVYNHRGKPFLPGKNATLKFGGQN